MTITPAAPLPPLRAPRRHPQRGGGAPGGPHHAPLPARPPRGAAGRRGSHAEAGLLGHRPVGLPAALAAGGGPHRDLGGHSRGGPRCV